MKLIQPSVEFLGEVPTDYEGNLKFIERAGRTCYKSESKGEPEKFVKKLIASGHLAMVEHSNFVAVTKYTNEFYLEELKGVVGKYLNVYEDRELFYVGGNLTAWSQVCFADLESSIAVGQPFYNAYKSIFPSLSIIEGADLGEFNNNWEPCPHNEIPKELRRYSVKFICNRAVSHELVRHRPCSFAQESQRFVNYSGEEMEFIEPLGYDDWTTPQRELLNLSGTYGEFLYEQSIKEGLKPQQARAVLPNATKTEIVVTADAAEWAHIKKLRTAKDADPEMQRIMSMVPWEEIL
jgi:thymidylate synthase (FAD)